MKLYSYNLSPFAARVRMAVDIKGIGLDVVEVVSPPNGTRTPEYLAINPMGKVPMLVLEDGTAIPESSVICEFLEDRFPDPSLQGDDAFVAAKVRLLERIVDTYLAPSQAAIYAQMRAPERDSSIIARAIADEQVAYAHIEHFMDPDGPFLAGAALSLADCALVPFLVLTMALARPLRRENPLDGLDRIAAYWDAVRDNPSIAKITGEIHAALAALRTGK